MRSAEQRCPAEPNAERITSSTTCSFSAVVSTNMPFSPPVSAMKGRIGPGRAASARLIAGGGIGAAGEGDAVDAGMAGQHRADRRAVAGQQRQQIGIEPGLVEQPHRLGGDQRGLFGGLGQHGIAGRQRGGDLAGEDRQREIPRADAGEHAASVQFELVGLADRAGQRRRPGELLLGEMA